MWKLYCSFSMIENYFLLVVSGNVVLLLVIWRVMAFLATIWELTGYRTNFIDIPASMFSKHIHRTSEVLCNANAPQTIQLTTLHPKCPQIRSEEPVLFAASDRRTQVSLRHRSSYGFNISCISIVSQFGSK